jgi:hypothetical protein
MKREIRSSLLSGGCNIFSNRVFTPALFVLFLTICLIFVSLSILGRGLRFGNSPSLGVLSRKIFKSGRSGGGRGRRISAARGSDNAVTELPAIHIGFTICGHPLETPTDSYGLFALKSLLIARENSPAKKRKYVIHIMSTMPHDAVMRVTRFNWEIEQFMWSDPLLEVRYYSFDELDAAVARYGIEKNQLPHTIFKQCAGSRLKLPAILNPIEVPRIAYIDWDVGVNCDLTALWNEFDRFNSSSFFGFSLNDPTGLSAQDMYKKTEQLRHPLGAVSSGVMLIDIAKMYVDERKVLLHYLNFCVKRLEEKLGGSEAVQKADYWELTKHFPLGDQDLLNDYLHFNPSALHLLAPQWNWCLADLVPIKKLQESNFQRPIPCILHFCGMRIFDNVMKEPESPDDRYVKAFFDYIFYFPLITPVNDGAPPGEWSVPKREMVGKLKTKQEKDAFYKMRTNE